ncbi:hypothetical protein CS542_10605 [Pedobacter sp. IW39]|nr:hypothetical protein CS542_10605 [Pedobacter sp. IW39]
MRASGRIYGRAYVRSADGQIIHDASGLPLAQQAGVNNNQLLGYANPDFVFGFNNRFGYKTSVSASSLMDVSEVKYLTMLMYRC